MLGYYEPSAMPVTITSRGTVEYLPGWLDERYAKQPRSGITLYESFRDFCIQRKPRKIVFVRSHALGDVIMLLPICRALHRLLELPEPIIIATAPEVVAQIGASSDPIVQIKSRPRSWHKLKADVIYNLNSALELDHYGPPASDRHRLDLYAQSLGFEGVRS